MAFSLGSVTAKFTAKINDFEKGLNRAGRGLQDFGSKGKKLEDQLKALQRRKETLKTRLNDLDKAGKTNTTQFRSLSDQLKNTTDKINTQKIRIGEYNSTVKQSNGILDGFKNALSKVGSVMATVAKVGIGGLITGLVTLKGFLAIAVKTAGGFETQMLKVKAISRATGEEYAELTKQAKDLGRTTAFTAVQVGEAQQFQAMAGLNVNQIMKATPSILNLAASANLDLGRSADIATNIMSQFSLQAEDMDMIVDTLALTVNTSNQNMEQLADAMNYLGPTAKAMGISLSEAAAITGIMASNGLQGSLGTRALGTSLTRLARPTEAMDNMMESLNLRFFDAKGNFVGMPGMLKQLEKATANMTMEQKQNTLATLFGAEAIQEWNILLETGSDRLSEYSGELADSGGTAQKMADEMLSGWDGAIKRMQSAWEGLLINVGSGPLLKGATKGIDKITGVLTVLNDKIVTISENPEKYINKFKDALRNVRDEILRVVEDIKIFFAPEIEFLKKAFETISRNFEQLVIPLLLLFAGVVMWVASNVLSALLYAWEQLREPVLAFLDSLINIWDALFPVIAVIMTLIMVLIVLLMPVLQIIWAVVVQVFSGILQMITGVINIISGILNVFIGLIEGLFTGDFSRVARGFQQIWEGIKQFLSGWWTSMKAGFQAGLDGIKNTLKAVDLFKIGVDIIQGLINGIKNMAGRVGEEANKIAENVKNTIKNALKIQSPSKIMEEFGKFTGEGFAIGLEKTNKTVTEESMMLSSSVTAPVSSEKPTSETSKENGDKSIIIQLYSTITDKRALDEFVKKIKPILKQNGI